MLSQIFEAENMRSYWVWILDWEIFFSSTYMINWGEEIKCQEISKFNLNRLFEEEEWLYIFNTAMWL